MSCTVAPWIVPTYQQFESFFFRDFPFAGPQTPPTDLNYVQPQDINNAISIANLNFSPSMFNVQSGASTAVFMYLAAFYLVENLKMSAKGIAAQVDMMINSKGAGGVSVASQFPEQFLKNPIYAMYTRNAYGVQYLSICYPYLIGGGTIVDGTTTFS